MGRKGTKTSNRINSSNRNIDHEEKKENTNVVLKKSMIIGRKVMIVVDSSFESKNALQWALTHTIQSQDMVILLYVTKPSKPGGECNNKEKNSRVFEFLSSMKNMCQVNRPEVNVEIVVREDKEKGPAIVEEAKRRGVTLLILGQKKRSITIWRLVMIWAKSRIAAGGGVVEYCIQNAGCLAIAVRRKSKKVGGYLITTKRQKDFWLLA